MRTKVVMVLAVVAALVAGTVSAPSHHLQAVLLQALLRQRQ